MGKMIEGLWRTDTWLRDNKGRFQRDPTTFRNWVSEDVDAEFAPQAGRYHLYVSYACPWAHRTLIVRALQKLEDAIDVSVVHPFMGEDGWTFDACEGGVSDPVMGANFLREIYKLADPKYTGRVTVPILWDKTQQTIVNNESREIIRMFNRPFRSIGRAQVDLVPEDKVEAIDRALDAIYEPINNGVYRAGFATTQEAYEQAVIELFEALDEWEEILANQRYACGSILTEVDVCLYTTLVRFDAVYYTHFKCNLRRICDYPNLWNYLKELYQIPAFGQTTHFEHIKQHYFTSHPSINPTRIVPRGPLIDLSRPHNRARLPGTSL